MRFESTALTMTGRRSRNEDAHCVDNDLNLFAVADGLGGHDAGDIASHLAIETLSEFLNCASDSPSTNWPFTIRTDRSYHENMVEAAVHSAHREIKQVRADLSSNMGTTLSALVFRSDRAVIGHVGDSRVYRLRDGLLNQLTRDHSLHEDMVGRGVKLDRGFAFRNVVTQALGMRGKPVAFISAERAMPGDVYLLCTDGLSNVLPEAHIADVLGKYSAEEACRELVSDAFEWGSKDNITAVVVRCHALVTN